MKNENKIEEASETTKLLQKAFSSVYDDIYRSSHLNSTSKAAEISHCIEESLEAIDNFGQGTRTVYLVNRIKEQCKNIPDSDSNKSSIFRILDNVLEMVIVSEKLFHLNGRLLDQLTAVTAQE